jgi:hypothetical protein
MSRVWLVEEWTPEDALDNPAVDDAYTVTIYDLDQEAEARAHAERCFGRLFAGEAS